MVLHQDSASKIARKGEEMKQQSRSAIFALIGAAISNSEEPSRALRAPLDALAAYCGATIELFVTDAGSSGAWRQVAGTGAGAAQIGATLAAARADALKTSAPQVGRPSDAAPGFLAVPLVARGQALGVLLATGFSSEAPQADAEELLTAVAPLFGLFLRAVAMEANQAATTSAPPGPVASARDDLLQALKLELARARRSRSGCAVLLSGVDRIEDLTATHGPAAGDLAIEAFADLLRETCRDTDVIGRLDDGRFAIVLAGSDSRGAQIAAGRLLEELHARAAVAEPTPQPLSASIGIAVFPVDGFSADELLANASVALAEARRLGGNQVAAA